jgi:large subunit ribosomal protein L25
MADATLTAQPRTALGKGPAGRARRDGLVPAVVYGLGTDTLSVSVPARELQHLLAGAAGANTLITLKLDGGDQLALARQIQRHPIKGTVLHVDFVRVRSDVAIHAEVPVRLIGEAEGVSRGGVLEQLLHNVSVEALPGAIPNVIELDISALEIGGSVHVTLLTIPDGVTLLNEPDELIAQITAPRVAEEEAAEGEAVEGEEGAAPAAAADGGGEGGDSSSSE